jgi:dTDP-4-dehydrorhamnose reductase
MEILILGHNGLLGNMVYKYFTSKNYSVITTDLRWNNNDFKDFILSMLYQMLKVLKLKIYLIFIKKNLV